jgi:hypothetical protein
MSPQGNLRDRSADLLGQGTRAFGASLVVVALVLSVAVILADNRDHCVRELALSGSS